MKILKIFLLMVFFVHLETKAQNEPDINDYIKSLNNLRTFALEKNKVDLAELYVFIRAIDSFQCQSFKDQFLSEESEFQLRKNIKLDKNEFLCAEILTNIFHDLDYVNEFLDSNLIILNLIKFGIIENKYPFKIKKSSHFYDELMFYNVNKDDTIAEIGAGNGEFASILSWITSPKFFYVNDVDTESIVECKTTFKNYNVLDSTKIAIIQGAENATNIQCDSIDKIILRRTYHHFSKWSKMLSSINTNLKSDGSLFIFESKKKNCRSYKRKSKLKKEVLKCGFDFIEEKDIGEFYALKFVKKKSYPYFSCTIKIEKGAKFYFGSLHYNLN
ncbi:MAG: class I SAM-dependent methyltransferase [Lewinellaceae bacterium]|nr:class I SAM-dependent methyltransferase [Lewinellaceae bacterium]